MPDLYIFYMIEGILAQARAFYARVVLGAQIRLLQEFQFLFMLAFPSVVDWILRADVSEPKEVEAASLFLFIPQQM